MRKTAHILFCLSMIGLTGSATAATLPAVTDSYVGTYNTESVNSGANLHTFYLPGLIAGESNYWQFDANGGLFDHTGPNATLTGTIVNNTNSTKSFDVDIAFDFWVKGGRVPKCELGAACGSAQYQMQDDYFEYFTYGAATLTGLDMLDGLILALSVAPVDGSLPPQLGYGANNKDLNEFGFSTWYLWNVTSNTTGVYFQTTGQGDINLELTPVPLPAALPLFAGGLGLMGLLGWRRKRIAAAA